MIVTHRFPREQILSSSVQQRHAGSFRPSNTSLFHPLCPSFLSQSPHSAGLCHGGSAPCSQIGAEQKGNQEQMPHDSRHSSCLLFSLPLSFHSRTERMRQKSLWEASWNELKKNDFLFDLFFSFTKVYSFILCYISASKYIKIQLWHHNKN